jgi:hypothetical protein
MQLSWFEIYEATSRALGSAVAPPSSRHRQSADGRCLGEAPGPNLSAARDKMSALKAAIAL